MTDRRSVVTGMAFSLVVPALRMPIGHAAAPHAAAPKGLQLGASRPFSFEDLIREMQSRAGRRMRLSVVNEPARDCQ